MRMESPPRPDFSDVRGRHVLIALSGGSDSTALAFLLADARTDLGLTLTAAHLDHSIRPDSADDAAFCRDVCARLNIPLLAARLDIPAEAARTGEGLETAARRLRMQWLEDCRSAVGADCIALAHHLEDQAETVLMHLARGTGPEGIAGMRRHSGKLYRPLLDFHKRQLCDYLLSRGISWREDCTNAVADTPRNAIRLHVLPALEKTYPKFGRAAARYAQSAAVESDYMAQLTQDFLDQRLVSGPFGSFLVLNGAAPRALLRRAIRAVCGSDLPWDKLNAVETRCAMRRGRMEISGTLTAERTGRGIYFLPKRPAPTWEIPLSLDGTTSLPEICSVRARAAQPAALRGDPMRQALEPSAMRGAVLRTRRPGDRIRPLGSGDKLLSDYFTDRKIDRPLRDCIALAAKGSRVLWVCGVGISEEARITDGSAEAVEFEVRYMFDMSLGADK